MLIGFPGNRSNDLYKAIVLSVEIKKENDYRKIVNRKEVEGSWLRRKVRDISVSHFLARYGPVSCESLEQIAQEMRIKINIWTQKNPKSPLQLHLEINNDSPSLEGQGLLISSFKKSYLDKLRKSGSFLSEYLQ